VVLREVDGSFYDTIVVHLHEVGIADFLVIGDEAFAMGAGDFQDMAAPDFLAIRIFMYFHNIFTL
jgi:hypothetical protein